MILTNEEFWCPKHGRQPQTEAKGTQYDSQGKGPYIPFYAVRCRQCGKDGALVCRGDSPGCQVQGGLCIYHECHIGDDPFPAGQKAARAQAEGARKYRDRVDRAERLTQGLWDGPSLLDDGSPFDDPDLRRGGIFR